MDELISVVIPTYGRADMLGRALDSVITQTYHNLEIIVVDDNADDGRSDRVSDICEGTGDQRIRVIHNKKNLGGALSRNVGIVESHARYIAFLDDDDEYYPAKIEKQHEFFLERNDPHLALVYCYCEEKNVDGITRRFYKYDFEGHCLYEGMLDCIAATSQWMCDKEKLLSVGMFSDIPCKQDSTLIVKLLSKGYSVGRVPEVLSVYHNHDQGRISSNNHKKRITGEEYLIRLCREQYDSITKKQARQIEYNFCKRVYKHYFFNKNYLKLAACFMCMGTTHPAALLKKIVKRVMR